MYDFSSRESFLNSEGYRSGAWEVGQKDRGFLLNDSYYDALEKDEHRVFYLGGLLDLSKEDVEKYYSPVIQHCLSKYSDLSVRELWEQIANDLCDIQPVDTGTIAPAPRGVIMGEVVPDIRTMPNYSR